MLFLNIVHNEMIPHEIMFCYWRAVPAVVQLPPEPWQVHPRLRARQGGGVLHHSLRFIFQLFNSAKCETMLRWNIWFMTARSKVWIVGELSPNLDKTGSPSFWHVWLKRFPRPSIETSLGIWKWFFWHMWREIEALLVQVSCINARHNMWLFLPLHYFKTRIWYQQVGEFY